MRGLRRAVEGVLADQEVKGVKEWLLAHPFDVSGGHRFDLGDFEDPKTCLPTVIFKEWVVIATQRGRKVGRGGENSIGLSRSSPCTRSSCS
jgi:hypothetical protein